MAPIYLQKKHLSYVDSLSATIPDQTINIGRFSTGAASTTNNSKISARLDAGLNLAVDQGVSLQFKGFFDGIGASHYKVYGGTSMLTVRF